MVSSNRWNMPLEAYDGEFWRERARLTYQAAQRCGQDHRQRLIRVASEYNKLAERADMLQIEMSRFTVQHARGHFDSNASASKPKSHSALDARKIRAT